MPVYVTYKPSLVLSHLLCWRARSLGLFNVANSPYLFENSRTLLHNWRFSWNTLFCRLTWNNVHYCTEQQINLKVHETYCFLFNNKSYMKFEVPMAVTIEDTVIWDVMACDLVNANIWGGGPKTRVPSFSKAPILTY